MDEIRLHYHSDPDKPRLAPHFKKIPLGSWVKDSGFWARRAFDDHIYDLLVDKQGRIYFWEDGGDWYPEGSVCPNIEEAKALAAVLFRLKEATE